MKWILIMILLSVFSFSIFTNDLIMQNNILYAQVELPLLSSPSSPSSDPLTTPQSILKTLVDDAGEALEKTNTTKTFLNLNK
jgi:hypothetical protein